MAKLPAKSNSKKIQQRHTRRIKTREGVKDIIINKGVRKEVPTRTGNARTPQPGPQKLTRTSKRGTGFPLKPSDYQPNKALKPKLRWQDTLKPQTKDTALEKAAKKIKGLNEIRKSLGKGERIAVDFTIRTESPMSTIGTFIARDEEGKEFRFPINHQMSNAGLLNYIYESAREGTPIIIQTAKEDFMGDFVYGARPVEKLLPADTIPYYTTGYAIQPAPTEKNPDRIIVTKGFMEGGESQRTFKNEEELQEAEHELAKKGLNIFMEEISPQKKIDEFRKKEE